MGRKYVTLVDLAEKVALTNRVTKEQVYGIVADLCTEMGKVLNKRDHIRFWNIGTFSVTEDEHGFPGIKFQPSLEFKKHVQVRPEMNKYGVLLDKNKVMTAKLTGICPDCQTELESKDPPKCPKCGTKPFEEKDQS